MNKLSKGRILGNSTIAWTILILTISNVFYNPCFGQSLVKVSSYPMHESRIDAKLFGNFVELLDDVVPSMWAEMINDRDFDGVLPSADWVYYRGEPNVYLDREWEPNSYMDPRAGHCSLRNECRSADTIA